MLDLSGVLAPKEGRGIEAITQEILDAKRRGGEAILTIGRCLTEAKQAIPRRFMKLYRECSNRPALADLGASKALMLLALPDSERDQFVEDHNVIDMSARQLEQAIKDRDEARKAAETAQAEASAAEQARAKMEEDMKLRPLVRGPGGPGAGRPGCGPAGGPAGRAEGEAGGGGRGDCGGPGGH